nr:hypothetical protein [Tanacetum cinerariifolium]
MLHISPRIPSESFAELPSEEEILEFLRIPGQSFAELPFEEEILEFLSTKPKASARKKTSGSASSTTPPPPIATLTPTTIVVATPRLSAAAKGKQAARATTPTKPTDVERTEAEQLKIALKRSRQETHISQQCGSGIDEGTGSRLGVPDVPSDNSEEELSWNSSDDENVDEQTKGREESEGDTTDESDDDADDQDKADKVNDDDDDEEETTKIGEQKVTESDEGDNEATKSDRESEDEETREQEEESFDPIPRTPEDNKDDDNNEEEQGLRIGDEERMQEEEDAEELYRDVDINQGRGLQVSQETEDTHVILTPTQSDAQQESSSTSSFMTNLLNHITDLGLESLFTTGSTTVTPIPSPQSTMTPSIISTFTSASQLPTPPTQILSLDLQSLPTFALVFRFEDRVKSLEDSFSNIPGIVNQYMHQQIPKVIREAMQTQINQLQDSIQRENDEFLKTIDENIKKIIKEQVKTQVKAQVTRILPRIEEDVNAQLEAEVLTKSSHSSRTGEYMSQEFLDHLKDHGIIAHRTPPYTPQNNGVSERRNRTLIDMVRSMMSQKTLPKSFWDYALETDARILNMVLTKKVEKTPYKETIGYSFYYPPENKVLVARNAEFLENSLINQEASGSLEDLEIIQEEDTHPSIDTSLNHKEDDLEIDEPQSDSVPIRRSTRTRHAPDRMCLYIDAEEHELGDLGEPSNYKAELLDPESKKWLNAMNVEMQSMKDNEVWVLVELPPNGKTVGSKLLFKKKTDMDEVVHTYKARLVAKGYTQTSGIDYEEKISPVAYIRAIRILIAIAAYYDYEIWQMDVKTAFLNGYLNEEVYMEQPEGFVNPKYPNRVCKLKRSIYGLKRASSGSNITFLILYVDDMLIMGNNIPMLQSVKSYLGRCFAMKDLGEAAYILGIKIYRDRSRGLIGLCQSAYIEKILKRYCMENSKRGSSIMYVVRCTRRPDVAFAQNVTSRFQQNPGDLHWTTVKNILKYLRNTKDMFLVYEGDLKQELKSAKQSIFATSSAEAEYIAAFYASKEAVWVRKFIYGLGVVPTIEEPISMYCDNTGAITIANESGITKGARHFRAKVHYLREVIEYGDIKLEKVHTDNNLADPFTKALAFPKHSEHNRNIGMLPASSLM